MSIDSVMPSNHLILCRPLLLLPSIFPSIGVFSSVSVLHIRWPKYWSFSTSSSNEYSGLISFRINWFDLLAVQGTLKSLLQNHSSKASIPGGSDSKKSACNAEDPGSIPGSGRSPGGERGDPLQDSRLENSMDRGAWWATVHGVAKSGTYHDRYLPTKLVYNIGSSSFPFCCFPLFLSLIAEEGFLISHCYYLKLFIQKGIPFLFSFVFSLCLQ